LNRAIAAAHGESILRLDGHSLPYPDYVARCLEVLEATGAANVGGQWDIRPSGSSWLAKAIAVAVAHRLGAGDARYRTSGVAGEVETVPFGAFPRAWLERVGGYDEFLLTNEDYELNLRLRQAGGRIWFDPQIRSIYFARPSIPALARQYLRYGYWKARMIVRHPRSLRWRQALPPLFVGLTAGAALLAAAWPPALRLLGVQWLAYLAVLLLAAAREASRRQDWALLVGLSLAFVTIHLCWGSAFLVGLLVPPGRGRSDRGA
jgi:GT2 family glycosyltransferase